MWQGYQNLIFQYFNLPRLPSLPILSKALSKSYLRKIYHPCTFELYVFWFSKLYDSMTGQRKQKENFTDPFVIEEDYD
jgi:hypothetical protein